MGKVLEQSLIEVLQEEELAAMRRHQVGEQQSLSCQKARAEQGRVLHDCRTRYF